MAGGLVSVRPSPAVELLGARRRRARLAGCGIFVFNAGEATDVGSGSVSPVYCTLFSIFVLCTVYVVLC